MKPELAVLPLEVWADIFVYPWITRRQLAQTVHRFRDRKFAEKLQFRLHDMGKQTLHYLLISSKYPNGPSNLNIAYYYQHFMPQHKNCKDFEFPENEMPENINGFKQLSISHLDDQVLAFLDKLKPTFANVFVAVNKFLTYKSAEKAENLRILLDHLLPMLASIRGFDLKRDDFEFLGRHFPEHLARAKELYLDLAWYDNLTFIPVCLNWLSAPHNFGEPKFLKILAVYSVYKTIFAIIDAVRKQFLAATSSSTFAIFIWNTDHNCADEEHQNGVTNEQLVIRKAATGYSVIHYVEIVRCPTGGAAHQMREWLKQRAHYEKLRDTEYSYDGVTAKQEISIWPKLTIGQITKKNGKAGSKDQDKDESTDHDDGKDAAGPSTSQSAKK